MSAAKGHGHDRTARCLGRLIACARSLRLRALPSSAPPRRRPQRTFATPEEAVRALIAMP